MLVSKSIERKQIFQQLLNTETNKKDDTRNLKRSKKIKVDKRT